MASAMTLAAANCMMHCGFEASALDEIGKSPSALWQMISWNLFDGRKQKC